LWSSREPIPIGTTVLRLFLGHCPQPYNGIRFIQNWLSSIRQCFDQHQCNITTPAVPLIGDNANFDLAQVTDAQLLTNIGNLNATGAYNNTGIFVLPIDRCFGLAQQIINAAQAAYIPTFWPVTDWVNINNSSALGGFGISQETCGERMGDQVSHIFKNANAVPTGLKQYRHFAPKDMTWLASSQAAQTIGITLPDDVPTATAWR
jgi:hypothetical protein